MLLRFNAFEYRLNVVGFGWALDDINTAARHRMDFGSLSLCLMWRFAKHCSCSIALISYGSSSISVYCTMCVCVFTWMRLRMFSVFLWNRMICNGLCCEQNKRSPSHTYKLCTHSLTQLHPHTSARAHTLTHTPLIHGPETKNHFCLSLWCQM